MSNDTGQQIYNYRLIRVRCFSFAWFSIQPQPHVLYIIFLRFNHPVFMHVNTVFDLTKFYGTSTG